MRHNALVKLHNWMDRQLKFPNLKKGDIGIQVGFDMSSANLTSDLWLMCYRVGKQGTVIGIDPDTSNHNKIKPMIEKHGFHVKHVVKGTSNQTKKQKLVIAERAAWNRVQEYDFNMATDEEQIDIELDTIDNIVAELGLDHAKISHVNITNNGAEYHTLLGMQEVMKSCPNMDITVIAGRPGPMGQVAGQADHEIITAYLQSQGYKTKFYRMSQLFWWGAIHQLLLKRRWVYGTKPYGVIMATKGKRRWFQSYC